jgi:hypothetical protein
VREAEEFMCVVIGYILCFSYFGFTKENGGYTKEILLFSRLYWKCVPSEYISDALPVGLTCSVRSPFA